MAGEAHRDSICLHLELWKDGVVSGKQRLKCKCCKHVFYSACGCDIHGRVTDGRVLFKGHVRQSALAFVNARFGMPVEEVLEHIEEGKLVLQRGLPYMQAQAYTHVIPTPIFLLRSHSPH